LVIEPTGWHVLMQHKMLPALFGSILAHGVLVAAWNLLPDEPVTIESATSKGLKVQLVRKSPPTAKQAAEEPRQIVEPVQTTEIKTESPEPNPPKVVSVPLPKPEKRAARQEQQKAARIAVQAPKPQVVPKPKPVIIENRPSPDPSAETKTVAKPTEPSQVATATGSHSEQATASAIEQNVPPSPSVMEIETKQQAAQATQVRLWLQEQLRSHFRYPGLARRRGLEGTVVLHFRVEKDGQIINIKVLDSSGHGILDRNAHATLENIGRVDHGQPLLISQALDLTLPVIYRLSQG
jgi:protein TonB